jgi:superfamily II DNA or RNA helicase
MNLNKDIEQKKALNLWWRSGAKNSLELPTAFGKCRIGVLASSYIFSLNKDCRILIVTPTTIIKEDWVKEFKKWGHNKVLNNVDIQCINTAREYKKNHYDLIILDEIHNYLIGTENSKVYKNNTYDKLLGLSATIDNSLLSELNKVAPICYSMDLDTAVELGLVSNYTIFTIGVDLTPEERKIYTDLSNKIDYAYQNFNRHSWKNISTRKELLYKASNKFKVLEEIVDIFNNKYGAIFSMTKQEADTVQEMLSDKCVSHHSGLSKKKRVDNLKQFSDGRTKKTILSSAKTLDEGVTLPRISFAIILASSSKARQILQRAGRVVRLADGKDMAYIIRLYVKNSKEEKWVNSIAELKTLIK